jgi:predicted site-specific integrase-resolvase
MVCNPTGKVKFVETVVQALPEKGRSENVAKTARVSTETTRTDPPSAADEIRNDN